MHDNNDLYKVEKTCLYFSKILVGLYFQPIQIKYCILNVFKTTVKLDNERIILGVRIMNPMSVFKT